MKPRIFISSVSSELGTTRQLVANVLSRLGYDPVWQDIFGTEPGDLRQVLRDKIDDCEGLIQLVGHGYGAEPPTISAEFEHDGFTRISYTQFEFLYARARGKKTWLIFADDGCTRDRVVDELDRSHDPKDPDPIGYQAERRALQDAWRQRWQRESHLFHLATNNTDIELKVERLRDEFAELRRAEHAWRRKVAWSLAAVVALVVLSVGIGMYVAEKQRQAVNAVQIAADEAAREAKVAADRATLNQQKTEQKIESSALETKDGIKGEIQAAVKELTNPVVLAERIRKEIHATAEAKIKVLPDEKGRGRLVAEIEKERDLALGRVDDLIKLIQEGLKEGASPVFQRAAEILQKEGTDEALAYLESRRPSTLEAARRHAEQAKTAQARADAEKELRNKSLQALVLEAELLEIKLQWQPALKLREQVAELAPDWFDARNRLGLLHFKLAHFGVAEPHLRATVELAAVPADEAVALNNLAGLLQATDRLAEAEPLMRRALAIDEQSYPDGHPNVAVRLNNLSSLLHATNRYAEAEPLLRRALWINEKFDGDSHPNVSATLDNLAQLLQRTNHLEEAESMMRRALVIDEQFYGASDPKVAIRLSNFAGLLKPTNRLAVAELLMRRALAIDEQSYGAAHPNIAIRLNNLGQLMDSTNRLTEAESLTRRALAIDEHFYGTEHPLVAIKLNNLATLLQNTKRLAEAESLMRRALAIDERSSGAIHPSVARNLSNLALLLKGTNRLLAAEPLMRRALAIDQQSFGSEHSEVANDLNSLAGLLKDSNRAAEAEPLYRRALPIYELTYKPEHPKVGVVLNNLARLLQATNRQAEAETLMARALSILAMSLVKDHPNTIAVRNNYRKLLAEMALEPDEIVQRVNAAMTPMGPLMPIAPEVERLLGPCKPVADVLAALDRQYKAESKPEIYFLTPDQPMAPHLAKLLQPNPESLNAAGVSAFLNGDHAYAITHYEESLKLLADKPEQAATTFTTRMNRGAALRELGEVEPARDELRKLLSGLGEGDKVTSLAKGRARYHLAVCEWRLNDMDAAQREAEESLKAYGDDEAAAPLKKQTEQLLDDLKENKPLLPLPKVDVDAALAQARAKLKAQAELANLSLDQSALPLLDQMLGPAKSTKEVFEELDRQSREQNKPKVWFLPLSEPIAPHLDELLGPVK